MEVGDELVISQIFLHHVSETWWAHTGTNVSWLLDFAHMVNFDRFVWEKNASTASMGRCWPIFFTPSLFFLYRLSPGTWRTLVSGRSSEWLKRILSLELVEEYLGKILVLYEYTPVRCTHKVNQQYSAIIPGFLFLSVRNSTFTQFLCRFMTNTCVDGPFWGWVAGLWVSHRRILCLKVNGNVFVQ